MKQDKAKHQVPNKKNKIIISSHTCPTHITELTKTSLNKTDPCILRASNKINCKIYHKSQSIRNNNLINTLLQNCYLKDTNHMTIHIMHGRGLVDVYTNHTENEHTVRHRTREHKPSRAIRSRRPWQHRLDSRIKAQRSKNERLTKSTCSNTKRYLGMKKRDLRPKAKASKARSNQPPPSPANSSKLSYPSIRKIQLVHNKNLLASGNKHMTKKYQNQISYCKHV